MVVYFLLLYTLLSRSDFWGIALSQVLAKYSMLLLMLLSKPSWDGMGSYFMEKISMKDAFIGAIPVALFCYKAGVESLAALASGIAVVILLKVYSEKHFGGVNGDVIALPTA